MADITLVNLNMLYVRYVDSVEREMHVPLGPLYLAAALEGAGFEVDFRDYQAHECQDPFSPQEMASFLEDPAPVLGVSCMANLLPFTLLALRAFKERHPDVTVVMGGVGPKAVERGILESFPWVDIVARGEGESVAPLLLQALKGGGDLRQVPGISFRHEGVVVETPRPARLEDLDGIPRPAFHLVDLSRYRGYGVVTSRGCPYPCTFCSVAPIWDHRSYLRSNDSIIDEMRWLHEKAGVELFLFQDEFFVSSPSRVISFCRALRASGLPVQWKAFGRVNLTDDEALREMSAAGCLEIRYGIESGSDRVLERTRKGFTSEEAVEVVSRAIPMFPRVDTFYVWGYPFETMDDFHQSIFQMVSFQAMGARVLPSLLSLLPQTAIYEELRERGAHLEFCPEILPEYMLTGHEICHSVRVQPAPGHQGIFEFIAAHPHIFPGFFHCDLEHNVRPKLAMLAEFGFYPGEGAPAPEPESCGAHSPRLAEAQFGASLHTSAQASPSAR